MTAPELLAIGLPTLSVLVGILLNRSDVSRLDGRISTEVSSLRGDIQGLRNDMDKMRDSIEQIRNDQREFYRTLGQHEVRLENLEKK
jgi:hypothetical protein